VTLPLHPPGFKSFLKCSIVDFTIEVRGELENIRLFTRRVQSIFKRLHHGFITLSTRFLFYYLERSIFKYITSNSAKLGRNPRPREKYFILHLCMGKYPCARALVFGLAIHPQGFCLSFTHIFWRLPVEWANTVETMKQSAMIVALLALLPSPFVRCG